MADACAAKPKHFKYKRRERSMCQGSQQAVRLAESMWQTHPNAEAREGTRGGANGPATSCPPATSFARARG